MRDADRQKMSKTKGNVLDPIEVIEHYGTDATRFTLASMAAPGTDIAFSESRTAGYRNFANKIWNAARFMFMNVDRVEPGLRPGADECVRPNVGVAGFQTSLLEDRWILSRFIRAAKDVNESLETYRFDEAANRIYDFFWGEFCDWYIEIVKLRLDFSETADKAATKAALTTLVQVFETSLRLLSPFMPFLTEELWHAIYDGNPPARSIALTEFPTGNAHLDDGAVLDMVGLQSLIVEVRALRKEIGVEEKAITPIEVQAGAIVQAALNENIAIVERLARVSEVRFVESITAGLSKHSTASFDVAVVYERTIDVQAERDRLTKDIAKYEKGLAAAERQLGNESFIQKAPAHIVEGLKKQESETRALLDKARAALENLPPE